MDENSTKLSAESEQKNGFKLNPAVVLVVAVGSYIFSQIAVGVGLYTVSAGLGYTLAETEEWAAQPLIQFAAILATSILLIGLINLYLNAKNIKWRSLGLVKPKKSDLNWGLIGFGSYFVIYLITAIIFTNLIPALNVEQKQELGFIEGITGVDLIYAFMSLAILPPIIEELTVRGFLYGGLRSSIKVVPAAILTSLIFAIGHLQLGSDNPPLWNAALDTFVLSLVLIWLKEKRGSLWPLIAVHFIKNSIAFIYIFIIPQT